MFMTVLKVWVSYISDALAHVIMVSFQCHLLSKMSRTYGNKDSSLLCHVSFSEQNAMPIWEKGHNHKQSDLLKLDTLFFSFPFNIAALLVRGKIKKKVKINVFRLLHFFMGFL